MKRQSGNEILRAHAAYFAAAAAAVANATHKHAMKANALASLGMLYTTTMGLTCLPFARLPIITATSEKLRLLRCSIRSSQRVRLSICVGGLLPHLLRVCQAQLKRVCVHTKWICVAIYKCDMSLEPSEMHGPLYTHKRGAFLGVDYSRCLENLWQFMSSSFINGARTARHNGATITWQAGTGTVHNAHPSLQNFPLIFFCFHAKAKSTHCHQFR